VSNFYTDVILKSPYTRTPNAVCKDLAMLEPNFRARVTGFITDAGKAGHKLIVLETYRSQQRQALLFAQHKTQLKNVGVHGYGLACDLGLMDPKYDPVGEHYAFFQALCVKYKMISGIDWGTPKARHTFHDWDHVQGVPVFRQNALFNGTWYPGPNYDPIQDEINNHIKGI
jgi:hypothetical protein